MHIDQELTQRFMHGELDATADRSVREHLAACNDCRVQLEESVREEEDVFAALRRLDHPRPGLTAKEVMNAPVPVRVRRAWGRRAAAILILGAAGAAYALPGSPVRGWVDVAIDTVTTSVREFSATVRNVDLNEALATTPPESGGQPGGLGVPPGTALTVVFEADQTDGTARVTLDDGDEVWASAAGGTASFTSADQRLLIGNAGSTANYEIRIPGTAPHVEIRVGQRSVFLKDGPTISTAGVAMGPNVWIVELSPADSTGGR